MKISEAFKIILDLPKTIFINLYYLPLKRAIKLPIRVSHDVKIGALGKRDSIKLIDDSRISIGKGGSFALGSNSYWYIGKNGKIIFDGNATFSRGVQIIANGNIKFGKNFWCNANCIINSGKNIEFGNDVLLGWNVNILDGDGHTVIYSGLESKSYEDIYISHKVWIASGAIVLKGSYLRENTIVAAKGLVSRKFNEENILIGGNNIIIRKDVEWRL